MDPRAMRLVERVRDLHPVAQRLVERERAPREAIGKRLAFEVLHHEERRALLLADVVERADMRVIEVRDRARFVLEAFTELQVSRDVRGQYLDRDGALQASVARFVDFAHAAGPERGLDLVRAEAPTGFQWHVWSGADYIAAVKTACKSRPQRPSGAVAARMLLMKGVLSGAAPPALYLIGSRFD
jgi:hypothetical protein